MQKSITHFFKKTYKLASVVIFVVIFFLVYNTYLVDRSLVNLKIALNKAAEAKTVEDLQRLKPFLRIPILKEISKKTLSKEILLSLETTENIASGARSEQQVEDIKFYLKSAIKAIEKERGGFLSALDNLNSQIIAPTVKLSKTNLEAKAIAIQDKIKDTKDKEALLNLYYELGNIYSQLSDLPEAEKAFLAAVNIEPKNPLAIKARFNLAWIYKSSGDYDKAKSYFEDLSKEFPELELAIASQYEMADTSYKKGDYAQARDQYAQLAEKYPQAGMADFALSQAGSISFYNLDEKEAAAKYLSELEEKYSQTEVGKHVRTKTSEAMATNFREEGYKLIKDKEYTKAIENFEKAVEIAPSDSQSVSGMGLGFYWLGRQIEALEKVEKAVHIATIPDELTLINSLFVYINTKRIDEAIKIGEEVLDKTTVPRAEFYYNMGYAYVLKSKTEKAISQFERAIRINPDFVFAYNNLGCVLWMRGEYEKSVKKFKEAIDRTPEYADAHFNLGIVYFNLNRFEDAYKEFKKVLEINPTDQRAQKYLNAIIASLGYTP